MQRLPGISQKEYVRIFERLGFRVVRESGYLFRKLLRMLV
ncbi:MAG: hypothetical protein RLZZ158_1051 [Cyanobacteriota bacterium]|jgi:predicted RNA binding protein YcfA (HicA-like mRNA interferase family)